MLRPGRLLSRQVWSYCVIAWLTCGCSPSLPKPDSAPSTQAAVARAEQRAQAWLDNLKAADAERVLAATHLPFSLRDTGRYLGCKERDAHTPAELRALLECMLTDELLREELQFQGALTFTPVDTASMPRWAADRSPPSRKPGQLLMTTVHGNGVSFELVLSVTPHGVAALWRDAHFEPE